MLSKQHCITQCLVSKCAMNLALLRSRFHADGSRSRCRFESIKKLHFIKKSGSGNDSLFF